MESVEAPVQRQLDAYNARSLERFLVEYAEDVVVYRPPETLPAIVGKERLAEHYAKNRFHLPQLHARLINRIVSGDIVVDQEEVTGLPGGVLGAVAVYKVKDGVIQAVWFF
jgi:hypothetical protein